MASVWKLSITNFTFVICSSSFFANHTWIFYWCDSPSMVLYDYELLNCLLFPTIHSGVFDLGIPLFLLRSFWTLGCVWVGVWVGTCRIIKHITENCSQTVWRRIVRSFSLCLGRFFLWVSLLIYDFILRSWFSVIQLPCKHVFCYACAKKTEKHCPRYGLSACKSMA